MTETLGAWKAGRRSFIDRRRLDLYLSRLEWHLEEFAPGNRRKQVLRSLRDEVAADPRSLTAIFRDLGPANALARNYVDDSDKLRPRWSIGVIMAAIALCAYWAIFLTYTGGMLAAVDEDPPGEAHSSFLFIQVQAFSNTDGFGIGWTSGIAWLVVPLVIGAAAFTLGSRTWRIFRRL